MRCFAIFKQKGCNFRRCNGLKAFCQWELFWWLCSISRSFLCLQKHLWRIVCFLKCRFRWRSTRDRKFFVSLKTKSLNFYLNDERARPEFRRSAKVINKISEVINRIDYNGQLCTFKISVWPSKIDIELNWGSFLRKTFEIIDFK